MHILEKWMRKYGFNVEASIHDGAAELQSVRISTDDSLRGVASVSVRDEKAGLVIIANRGDVLFIIGSAEEEVFNQVTAAFEYYNSWEHSLLRGAFEGSSLQELLDIAQLAFVQPMLIQNSRYEIVGITESYGPQVHPIWRAYFNSPRRIVPFSLWFSTGRFNSIEERASLREPTVLHSGTFGGNFILANLFIHDVRVGHVTMYEYNAAFGPGDLQLMKVFQEILTFYINADRAVLFGHNELDSYLEQTLCGENLTGTKTTLRTVYKETGWSDDDSFLFIHFRADPAADEDEVERLENEIQEYLESVNCVYLGNNRIGVLCCMASSDQYAALTEQLHAFHSSTQHTWGISQPFFGLSHLEVYASVAKMAAEVAADKNVDGLSLRNVGISILLQDANFRTLLGTLEHPELTLLRTYDQENHTQLAATIFWYLYSNCSYSDTATRMATHRNTVYYRVLKAFEIVDSHAFDSLESRLLYQLSYIADCPSVLT